MLAKLQISQDDGPLPPGRELNEFFKEMKQPATHFYIGSFSPSLPLLLVGLTDVLSTGANVVANTVRPPLADSSAQ